MPHGQVKDAPSSVSFITASAKLGSSNEPSSAPESAPPGRGGLGAAGLAGTFLGLQGSELFLQ